MTPAISVIMPAYNGAAHIAETIHTVLAQSFADWELVIVDDCSTDGTLAVLARCTDPRIRVIESETNGGPVAARNLAFAATRGAYIAALDQDDLCHPERFARQFDYLEAHPEIVAVASAALIIEDGISAPWPGERSLSPASIDWLLLTQNPLVWSTLMFRAAAARRLDPFERPEVRYAEDFDLYHRLRAHGRIARLDAPLLSYRVHPGGASQKFGEGMAASAQRVVEERYAAIFGEAAADAAALVVRHLMARTPVPDIDTLGQISRILARLHDHFTATNPLTPREHAEVGGEHARLWWLAARPALRRGNIRLRDVLSTRPALVSIDPMDPKSLIAPVIGRARRLARSLGARA